MTSHNYAAQQARLALALADALGTTATDPASSLATKSATGSAALGVLLIDAVPYFQCAAAESAHRGALAGACLLSMPSGGIAAQPSQNTPGSQTDYTYDGPYADYAQAFGPSGSEQVLAQAMAQQVGLTVPALDANWLGNYGLALVAQACGAQGQQGTNANAVSSALATFDTQLAPALTASYALALTQAYAPTSEVFATIAKQGAQVSLISQVDTAILSGHFGIALQTVAAEPNGQQAVDWFMFNLWTLLYGLGLSVADIDVTIKQAAAQGLPFSSEVGASAWWSGGYTAWYT
ncbi:MAG TPA: hypothetical protein VH328_02555, partial [Burkholderiaceae bacterium]|nr:hypothetical protein [Burkholderiaceae bacterium]